MTCSASGRGPHTSRRYRAISFARASRSSCILTYHGRQRTPAHGLYGRDLQRRRFSQQLLVVGAHQHWRELIADCATEPALAASAMAGTRLAAPQRLACGFHATTNFDRDANYNLRDDCVISGTYNLSQDVTVRINGYYHSLTSDATNPGNVSYRQRCHLDSGKHRQ